MYRKFIATITAASIAITAFGTTPARADNDDDVARALAAILGVAVLGAIINDNKRDDHVYAPHRPRHAHNPHRPRLQPKPLPHRVKPRHQRSRLLPAYCLRDFSTRRGTFTGYASNCLHSNFAQAHRLPGQCLTRLRTPQGKRHVYGARCLRDYGYRLARR